MARSNSASTKAHINSIIMASQRVQWRTPSAVARIEHATLVDEYSKGKSGVSLTLLLIMALITE